MTSSEILKKAQKEKYAVGQFNISTDEQLKAIIQAADELKSPVIIGTSEGERGFIGTEQAAVLTKIWQQKTKLPIILNADHCKTIESAKEAIDAGYTAIHFDGSTLPIEENIKKTKEIIRYAKSQNPNILIEGELGYLRGSSEIHKEKTEIKKEDFTTPEEAEEFIQKTKADSLAIVIGNIHGIDLKNPNPSLDIKRIKQIKKAIKDTFLVLHGGSGVSKKDIKEAIKQGIVKININTELRIAYSQKLRESMTSRPDQVKPYKILTPAVEAVKEVVKEKIRLFGSENKA
ncbi:MAG: ketose-bisphosphate aldolase [Candidatus Portnoybacteria bacterium]|nr:ketose-bisphosphate aldolase [Candidatus Portnoybacteria bacterium]